MSNKTLIIIPAHDEEESIVSVLNSVIGEIKNNNLENFIDILVIDDFSTDNTNDVCSKFDITVIKNFKHLGYGSSLQVGYRYAINNNYDFVIQMDGDGQHDAKNISSLYNEIHKENTNIVLGNRYANSDIKISKSKSIAVRYFCFLLNKFRGLNIQDPTSGLQALDKSVVYYYSKFNQFDSLFPDSNIILEASKAGFSITEIPVIMHERKSGKSQFRGLRPIYYMLYMTIATISVKFRKDINLRYNNAIKFSKGELYEEE